MTTVLDNAVEVAAAEVVNDSNEEQYDSAGFTDFPKIGDKYFRI